MRVAPIWDIEVINKFLEPMKNEVLCDEELNQINTTGLKNNSNYIGVYVKDELITVIKYEYMTPVTVCYHFYLRKDLWGKGIAGPIAKELDKWFLEKTSVHKLCIYAPEPCKHTIRTARLVGWTLEGVLTSSVVWKGKIENMIILSRFIRR